MTSVLILLSMAACFAFAAVVLGQEAQTLAAALSVPATTETLVLTGFAVTLPSDHAKALVRGWLDITLGTATTAVTVAIYRGGTISGTVVGTRSPDITAVAPGGSLRVQVEFIDAVFNIGGAQYTMSVKQTGATGAGNVTAALLDTTLLSG